MTKGTSSYRIIDEEGMYFLTITTVEWINVFTRKIYKDIIVDSLKFCQEQKGLEVFCWVLMSNHLHMIVRAKLGIKLSGIIRDFKKHTSKKIIKAILEGPESRTKWLFHQIKEAARVNSKKQTFQLWRNDNHPIELTTNEMIDQKVEYIHNNPVVDGTINYPSDYCYSSATNYAGEEGILHVILV